LFRLYSDIQQKTPINLSVKSETRNVETVRCKMTTNKSVERSNAPQETATDCA